MTVLTLQFDLHIHEWQWLIIDEDYIDLDYAVMFDRNTFNVKGRLLKPLDYTSVRWKFD